MLAAAARLAVRRGVAAPVRLLATDAGVAEAAKASSSAAGDSASKNRRPRQNTKYTEDRKRFENEYREARLRIIEEVKQKQLEKQRKEAQRQAILEEKRRQKAKELEEIRAIRKARDEKEAELRRQRKERRIAAGQQSQREMIQEQREELMHMAREFFEGSENWIVGDTPESMAKLQAMVEEAMKPENRVSFDQNFPEEQWDEETETWARFRYGDVEQELAFKPEAWGLELDTSTLPREGLQTLIKQRNELLAAGFDLPPAILETLEKAAAEQGIGKDGEELGDMGDTRRQAELWKRQERLKQQSMQLDTTHDRRLEAARAVGVGSGDPLADLDLDEEPAKQR
eukprot:tig00021517_g21982.t1